MQPTPHAEPIDITPQRRFLLPALAIAVLTTGWLVTIRGGSVLTRPTMLYVGWVALGACVAGLGWWLSLAKAPRTSRQRAGAIILVLAAALHLATLILQWPMLSDDVVRYRFDGRQWVAGRNAYVLTAQEMIDFDAADPIDRLTPHPTTTALYLPTSQLYFAAVAAIENRMLEPRAVPETAWRPALSAMGWWERAGLWRIASSLLALACTALLLRILRQLDRSAWWASVFAWHPLTLLETAGSAHQDVLGIAVMLLAVWLWLARREKCGVACFVAAAFVKPVALLPLLAWLDLRSPRRTVRVVLLLVVLILCGALATLYLGGSEIRESLHRYATTWEFNGGGFEFLKWLTIDVLGRHADSTKQHLRHAGGAIVAMLALVLWLRRVDALALGAWVMTLSCLVSPVLYPWYLLWPLALIATGVRAARWTVLTWCATSVLSYAVLHEPVWTLPAHLLWAEYLPVLVALGVDLRIASRRGNRMELTASSGRGA